MRYYFLFFFFALSSIAFSQDKQAFTISGTIKDAGTGETLIGANIVLYATKQTGTLTNAYGFFSINANEGTYKMSVSFTGYVTDTSTILIDKNQHLIIGLQSKTEQLKAVMVTSKRSSDNIAKATMGGDKLNLTEVNKIPVLLGEKDVLKTIQLLPGYKSAGEGNSGFNVRGGGTEQNLILLDEAPVYNASHLFGFFSTFNSDAIKDVIVYKGGMPAQYGGRLSSVVDIKMKDGNQKKLDIEGGLGAIASRLNVSAPIVKDKGSFIISARRTYADVFLKLIKDTGQGKQTLYFYDINLKANYKISKKDRIFLSGYFGRDELGLGNQFSTDWGNKTATLRWNHVFGNSLFSNTSFIFSNFDYKVSVKFGSDLFRIFSKIEDLNFKQDFDWNISNKSKLRFGGNIINHTIAPGAVVFATSTGGIAKPFQNRFSNESAMYVSHELKATVKLEIIYGLRASNLSVKGAGNFYNYDMAGNIISTTSYAKGETVVSYFNLEPRFSASYKLTELSSLKASYNRNVQNLHLITNATANAPYDVWLPSTNNIKPEIADQYAVGYYKNSSQGMYEFSSEVYYKALENQIDYRNAAIILGNDNVESELLYGIGKAYGLEMMMRKKTGRLTGWVGYTLSKVEKKIEGINNGNYFNARQDRTHDISVVGIYDVNKRWNVSATWVYTTGNAVTFPTGKYEANGQTVFLYSDRNTSRFPAYHHLDLGATLEARKNKKRRYQSSWTYWKLSGWKISGTLPNELKKMVLVVAPHTSWKHILVGLAVRYELKIDLAKFLGKKELFEGPFGRLFRNLGGIPVDRFGKLASKQGIVDQAVRLFNENEHFILGISPEGTRKRVEKLKTGFYQIAKNANIPIVLVGFDFKNKQVILREPMFASGDESADFKNIIAFFSTIEGANPELGLGHLRVKE